MEVEWLPTGPLEVNTVIVPLAAGAVLVVDPAACPFSGDEKKIVDYLDERDCVPVGILLTHGHFDHVSGLKTLRAAYPGIPIAIHKADADSIGANSRRMHERYISALDYGDALEELSGLPEADFFVEEGDTLDKFFSAEYILSAFTGDKAPDVEAVLNTLSHWKVLHTPGHSKGSVCFYSANDAALVSGDTMFYQSYGRTDLDGGSEYEMRQSLRRLFTELPENTKVYPGHGLCAFELKDN